MEDRDRISEMKASGKSRPDASLGLIKTQKVADRLKAAGLECYGHNLETLHVIADRLAQLLAERKKLRTDSAAARAGAASEGHDEPVRLRRSEGELQRLRREVARLRPLAGAMPPAVAPPEPPPSATVSAEPPEPGTFIVGRDLNFTGYSTPEAAMQSIVWCIVAGSYDAFLTALSPEDRALELEQPDGRASFEERQQQLAPLFHGMQVAALKVLADDAVELKVLLDFGSPTFHIQPLVRINAQWRPSESARPTRRAGRGRGFQG